MDLEERVCVREREEEVVEWQSLLVCRERSISHAAAVCEHPRVRLSFYSLSFIHSFILSFMLYSSPSPFQFLHFVANSILFKWGYTCKHTCTYVYVCKACFCGVFRVWFGLVEVICMLYFWKVQFILKLCMIVLFWHCPALSVNFPGD